MGKVKKRRRYDARGRIEQARRSREVILDVARRAFLERGYASTTIDAVAQAAGVSVETIYKRFGGKPGLVGAIYQQGLAGHGDIPAPERSDAISAGESDPHA